MREGWGTGTELAGSLPCQGPRVGSPSQAEQSRAPGGAERLRRQKPGRMGGGPRRPGGVLTASPRACSISLWSLSPGPMCLRAKSSCLGRRRSRRRESPALLLSPPQLLLSRPRGTQRSPLPPARRRPPPTPQPKRSPQALAHVCMVAATVPCPGPRGSAALSASSGRSQVAAAFCLEPLLVGHRLNRRMRARGQ